MEASEVGVWRLLKNDDNGQSWVIYMFILTKWLTQVGGDEISCNDIMAGLLRTGTLSRIDFHQGVETRSLSPSRPQMPPDIYVYCLIPASTGTPPVLNQIQSELHQYSSRLLGRTETGTQCTRPASAEHVTAMRLFKEAIRRKSGGT